METCTHCNRDSTCLHQSPISSVELYLLIAFILIVSQLGYLFYFTQLDSTDVYNISLIGTVSVTIILLFMIVMYIRYDKQYLALFFGCHQLKERSLHKGGIPFILCARCTGIMVGMFLSIGVFLLALNVIVLFILIIPLCIDGVVQRFTKYDSRNVMRLFSGILFAPGFLILYSYINYYIHSLIYSIGSQLVQLIT